MAESANKQLLSALTEGHEKALRSSARNSNTSTSNKKVSSSSSKSNNNKTSTSNQVQPQKVVVGSHPSNNTAASATVKCK